MVIPRQRAPATGSWRGPRGEGASVVDDGQGEQLLAGRADLDVGVHLRADAAVEARGPAAVLDLDLLQRVLPVLPEPVLVEAAVQVVPGQHLLVGALAGGVPVDVDAGAGQALLGGGDPALVREVLAPAVEAAAVLVDGPDDGADPAVAAGEQALDDAGLAVVVAEADVLAELAVAADRVAQLGEPLVGGLGGQLRGPLERGVRLGDEAADRDRAADVVGAGDLAALGDDVLRHGADLEDVLVGLGGQAAHEVQLHLAPAVAVRGGHRVDQVLFGDHLVDDLADPLGAALGGEGEAGAAAVAGQLVGEGDVEGVDPGGGQREADLVLGVAVGQALGDVGDLGVVRGGQRGQAELLGAGGLQALLHHLADAGD